MFKVLVVCDEHVKRGKEPEEGAKKKFAPLVEELSGGQVTVVRYSEVIPSEVEQQGFGAVILTGCGTNWSEYHPGSFAGLHQLIRRTDLPLLGICGGHQVIAQAYVCPVDRMRLLRPKEEDPWPEYRAGAFKEKGFVPVKVLKDSPLFADLPETLIVAEAHANEMKGVPAGYHLLAATEECPVQAIQSRTRLVFGTQFHPESHDDEHPHGKQVVANFLAIAQGKLG